jgi:sugar transferase (PEP-CTERM system associated)
VTQGSVAEIRSAEAEARIHIQQVEPDHKPQLVAASSGVVLPFPSPRNQHWRMLRGSVELFGQSVDVRILLLAGVDAVMLAIAMQVAMLGVWPLVAVPQTTIGWISLELVVFLACAMACLTAVGLYNRNLDLRTTAVLARVLVGFMLVGAVVATLAYLVPVLHITPTVLSMAFALALPLLGLSRAMFVMLLGRDQFSRRVLVYGCGERARELKELRVRQDLRDYEVFGYIPTESCGTHLAVERRIAPPADLRAFVLAHDIDEVVVAMDDRRRGLPVEQLLSCRLAGVPVTDVLSFIERESGKVKLAMFYPSWLIFTDGINRRGMVRLLTRLFDMVGSFVLLVLFSPLMLLTGLAVWLESGCRGPVLFRQQRLGLNGAGFRLYKIRSMTVDAEKNGPQWAADNDPRVTRVGSFIRRTRLDELPQLFNVLRGDMSFVGPRPERPEFVEQLSKVIPYYSERHCVKPGITGWAQISYHYGASEEDALEKLQYDLYYVKHKSLLFDLSILLQTAEVVLWRKGGR